ncbi:RIP metalloprotease RseP [Lactonifactor longoviformis]|uniref:Zinc metalloprotease n=1 Tax=Lactonifactor longoviformis DSM 17459 TaxID=1122155 RepID=A0A1M4SR30_9CLOT|nr:RIP metalloprotease RseP [Lactonifactor longoviformis]SHE34646.1 regulator of sigma E protease [Lactonifactor longoviformis DSM 17459]
MSSIFHMVSNAGPFLIKLLVAMLVFSVIVIFHELGHFLLAKRNGIGVVEFSLGMGPRLISTVKGETRYSVKLLPFGGSCIMVGEDGDEQGENTFNNAPIWGRIAVVAAGPIFNFFMAFAFAMIIVSVVGYDPAEVMEVPEGSPAAEAGLQAGDIITKFEGRSVDIARDMDTYIALHGLTSDEINLTYTRDGKKQSVRYQAESVEKYMLGFGYTPDGPAEITSLSRGLPLEEAGLQIGDVITSIDGTPIGDANGLVKYLEANPLSSQRVTIGYERDGKEKEVSVVPRMNKNISLGFAYNLGREKTNFLGVMKYSFIEVKYWIRTTVESLFMLVKGQFTVNDLSGPVGIVNAIGDSIDQAKPEGTKMVSLQMIYWAILLSANLGVMNLLPIPALDGGRLVFLIIEAIRGKALNRNVEGMVHFAGFMLLMALMVFVMFNDIRKLF